MGWDKYMVGAEYDGDHHRTKRDQYVKDIRRLEAVARLGWRVVRVVKEDRPADVIARVRTALISRGWRDT
jgi:very-short-patch-repair endonuclease